MSTNLASSNSSGKQHPLAVLLFMLAGLTLLSSLLSLFYGLTFEHGFQASTIFLQTAFGSLAGQIISLLVSGIQTTLLAFSGVLFLASILMYSVLQSISKASSLAKRVTQLEEDLAVYELPNREIQNETLA